MTPSSLPAPYVGAVCSLPRLKKGEHWTAEEHHQFLRGLDELGRGSWRSISQFYVPSRTPAQVASHAQKYFLKIEGKSKSKVPPPSTVKGEKPAGSVGTSSHLEKNPTANSTSTTYSTRGEHWNEDEHQQFLLGLQELGKGAWRAISTKYVPTRTPTQVASHSQKYFSKLAANSKKRPAELSGQGFQDGVSPPDVTQSESRCAPTQRYPSFSNEAKRLCVEHSEESTGALPKPLLPLAGLSPGSYQHLFHTLQDLVKEHGGTGLPLASILAAPVASPTCNFFPKEQQMSSYAGPRGMVRVASYCSSDSGSVADSSMGSSSSFVVRPVVKRASPDRLAHLQRQLGTVATHTVDCDLSERLLAQGSPERAYSLRHNSDTSAFQAICDAGQILTIL